MRAKREGASRGRRVGRTFRVWLACLSLLLQLAATAGHFHREDFALIAAGRAAALAASDASAAPMQPSGQPTLPSHDDCSLCVSLQIVGSSALPMPVLLPAPHEHEHGIAAPRPATVLRLTAAAHLLFQTRAPPIA